VLAIYYLQEALIKLGDALCALSKMAKFRKVDGTPGTHGVYRKVNNIWVGMRIWQVSLPAENNLGVLIMYEPVLEI
jgi:hypothetical protein